MDTELGAVYVLGNFDVVNRGEKWVIVPAHKYDRLADWQELGAPFYPWEMRYSKFYDVQDTGKRHWVKADRWNGSVAEVWVNDRKVGVIFSDPYTLDITPYLTKGGNHVELRVVGSMQTLSAHTTGPMTVMSVPTAGRWTVRKRLRNIALPRLGYSPILPFMKGCKTRIGNFRGKSG